MNDRFAHQLRIDQLRDGQRLDLIADDVEGQTIARRLGLAELNRLESHVTLARDGALVRAEGRLSASVVQACAVTGEPVPAHVDEAFAFLFVPEPRSGSADEEIELGATDCDTIFYDGAIIDLGAAIADTLALNLEPYPRSAGAEAALKEAGVLTEDQASPFAILERLKRSDG